MRADMALLLRGAYSAKADTAARPPAAINIPFAIDIIRRYV